MAPADLVCLEAAVHKEGFCKEAMLNFVLWLAGKLEGGLPPTPAGHPAPFLPRLEKI